MAAFSSILKRWAIIALIQSPAWDARAHSESTPPPDPAGWRQIVKADEPMSRLVGDAVVCTYRYRLEDGSTVTVLSRYDPPPMEPDEPERSAIFEPMSPAWKAYHAICAHMYEWVARDRVLARQAAQAAALRRPGDARIVIVRDHWGRAMRAAAEPASRP